MANHLHLNGRFYFINDAGYDKTLEIIKSLETTS